MNTLASLTRFVVRAFINRTRFSYRRNQGGFSGCVGLEIGGPSDVFRKSGSFPVYSSARRLDNLDFSKNTFWSKSDISPEYRPSENLEPGISRFLDTSQLEMLEPNGYDFLLASHVIEHLSNPIKSILHWKRLVHNGGLIVIIAPEKRFSYDRNRSVTPSSHLVADFLNDTPETDLTHLSEVMEKHLVEQDTTVKDIAELYARTQNNAVNRVMHHHVFNLQRLIEVGIRCGLELVAGERILPRHILCIFRKVHE